MTSFGEQFRRRSPQPGNQREDLAIKMISVEEALRLVAKHAKPLAPGRADLADCAGLILADDVTSELNSPPYDKAQMDGYAVASHDQIPQRQVIETVAAGDLPRRAVTPGTAIRIMTGAPIPEGADAVVPFENTKNVGDHLIELSQTPIESGDHVFPLGHSVRAGQTILRQGTMLRPVEIGILAEAGRNRIQVIPQPKVAILPTGNELVAVGQTVAAGQIRNSNGPLLTAAVQAVGGVPSDLGIGRDDPDELRRLISTGLEADVLLLSGGVSAGDFDLVPETLSSMGVQNVFHRISLRPGKPLWFGVLRGQSPPTLVFGLPGNPVSSFVCFELFVRPALGQLAGHGFHGLHQQEARLSSPLSHRGGRATFLPAHWENQHDPVVEIVPWQNSADLAALAAANCLVVLPAQPLELDTGSVVSILLI